MKINELSPHLIWHYFQEITQIPRPSKKEGKMIHFLEGFAREHQLNFKCDGIGNVLITKGATAGYETHPTTILQSHLDMVCEKNADINHDFSSDPIQAYVDGEWVRATGTTLGADDGIGIAAQLAVLASKEVKHGPLECLFTVDEETGLTGAFALEKDFMKGSILLNLDSEDDGEIFIGCAGGIQTNARFAPRMEENPEDSFPFQLAVFGLLGGHSGDDINKGRGNAIVLLSQFLHQYAQHTAVLLQSFNGGHLHNAIPREAKLVGMVPLAEKENLRIAFNEYIAEVEAALKVTEPHIQFELRSAEASSKWSFSDESTRQILEAFTQVPNGVIGMHPSIADLVETSSNLASVVTKDQQVLITTSQRSSNEAEKEKLARSIKEVLEGQGFQVTQNEGYPGWAPNPDSAITALTARCYLELFNEQPKLKAIHAGLECGLFLEKYPHLDMVSFGPTIRGAHSPNERLEIATVDKFWKLLLSILEKI